MPRQPEQTARLTHADIRLLNSRLTDVLGTIGACQQCFEDGEIQELWVFKMPSAEKGLERLEPFAEELRKSLKAAQAGKPLGPDSTKRGTRAGTDVQEKKGRKRGNSSGDSKRPTEVNGAKKKQKKAASDSGGRPG